MNRLLVMTAGAIILMVNDVHAQDVATAPVSPPAANASISLKDVDTNHDGKVSSEESQAYIRKLQEEEAARQRALTQPQITETTPVPVSEPAKPVIPPKPVTVAPKKPVPVKKEWARKNDAFENQQKKYDNRQDDMKAMDANGDGILQAGELEASNKNKFNAADTNKDGVLSPEETAASLEKFKAEKAELQGAAEAKNQAHRIENRYKQADKNRDGQVSQEEYSNFMNERQSTFDRNNDGIISEDEYRGDGEKTPSGYKPKKE